MSKDLLQEVKELIITELEIEDVSVEEISDDEPIFGGALGLDSIDALEIGVAIQKKYGIKLRGKSDEKVQSYFASIRSLADFIAENIN